MKKILSLSFFLLIVSALSSQTIIDNPEYGFVTTTEVTVDKIILDDETTTIFFTSKGAPGQPIEVPENVKIASTLDWQIDSVIESKGIRLGQPFTLPESGEFSWQAIYPAISDSTTHIDVGTFFGTGSWLIYDIKVREPDYGYFVPAEIKGNWASLQNGDWKFGIFDTLVIYDKQLWKISDVENEKHGGKIKFVSGDRAETIAYRLNKKGECSFAVGNKELREYVKVSIDQYSTIPPENESFKPLTTAFDSVTIEGYIHHWNQRMGGSGIKVYVQNIFNSSQTHELVDVSKDGYFSMKIPCFLPSSVTLSHLMFRGGVFIEPGQSIFVFIDPNDMENMQFMGASARINKEFMLVNKELGVIYFRPGEEILTKTAEAYKSDIKEKMHETLAQLDKLKEDFNLSNKTMELETIALKMEACKNMINYERNVFSAYIKKHNLGRRINRSDLPDVEIPAGYFDFLDNDILGDTLSFLSGDYRNIVSSIQHSTGLTREIYTNRDYDLVTFKNDLEARGMTFTEDEISFVEEYEAANTEAYKQYTRDYSSKYGRKYRDLLERYDEKFEKAKATYNVNSLTPEQMREYLSEQGLLTKEDQDILDHTEEFYNHPARLEMNEISEKYPDAKMKFMVELRDEMNDLRQTYYQEQILMEIKERWGIQDGIFTDIVKMQQVLQGIEQGFTPLEEEQIARLDDDIHSEFMREYILQTNQEIVDLIERNRRMLVSNKNETPEDSPEALFASIVNKYKGKVVYVDFWASWCGPCRSGIKRIAPLKAELADEDIVFLYITGPSTPEETWENMTPTISGEHYRVDSKEWNELTRSFRIRGIPHYMLISKEGEIVNSHMPHMGNEQLKQTLLMELKK